MKLDILAIMAHPDDAELSCAGSIMVAIAQGKKVGILDLTRGELGTRGTPDSRAQEAANASEILGISIRENAGLPDGFLSNTKEHQLAILPYLRRFQPEVVLTNAVTDRHPDHGKAAKLVSDACFLSGLKSIITMDARGESQKAWRPKSVYHVVQDRYLQPDFIVDISDFFEKKMQAIRAFETQFYTGAEQKPEEVTPISTPEFLQNIEARALEYGRLIGVKYGEGFTTERPLGVSDFAHLK